MRIGLVAFDQGLGRRGGVQVYGRELLRALARHGDPTHEYVLLLGADDAAPELDGSTPVRVARVSWPGGGPRPEWRRRAARVAGVLGLPLDPPDPLSRQIDALGLDAVHYLGTRFEETGLRTPIALSFFDMQEEFQPAFFPMREALARRAAHRRGVARATLVVVPSEFTARSLRQHYATPSNKIELIPVGVADRFAPEAAPGERRRLEAELGLPPGDFAFYPANPWPHKNHLALFRALAPRRPGEWAPAIVCCGRLAGHATSVGELARRAGYPAEQVLDLGFVDEAHMPALYRAARALVFPSLFEGFGLPVLEAMASGCPVACSDAASLPELGGDAVRGFDATSRAELRAAFREVWQAGPLRERLRERGLARAAAYRWERLVPRLVAAYARTALAEPRGG